MFVYYFKFWNNLTKISYNVSATKVKLFNLVHAHSADMAFPYTPTDSADHTRLLTFMSSEDLAIGSCQFLNKCRVYVLTAIYVMQLLLCHVIYDIIILSSGCAVLQMEDVSQVDNTSVFVVEPITTSSVGDPIGFSSWTHKFDTDIGDLLQMSLSSPLSSPPPDVIVNSIEDDDGGTEVPSTILRPFGFADLELLLGPRRQDLVKVIPVTIIYALIFVTGLVGNVSTCIVIARNRYMHTATNYCLFNLAVSDLLMLVLGLPQETYSFWSAYPWIFGETFCVLR